MKRILYFMPDLSLENNAGNKTRVISLLKYFKQRNFKVDYFGVKGWIRWQDGDDERMLQTGLVDRVFVGLGKPPKSQFFHRLLYKIPEYFKRKYYGIDNAAIKNMSTFYLCKQFNKVLKENKYDYIIVNYSWWANIIRYKKFQNGARTIIDTQDLLSAYEYHTQRKRMGRIFEEEMKRISLYDEVWAVSVEEQYVFSQFLDNYIRLVPNIPLSTMDMYNESSDSPKKYDIIYVASDNNWNKESAKWFFSEVYPLLPASFNICIIGRINDHIQEEYPNVTKIRFVESLGNAYASSRISICPMLGGTGVKLKVIEAMSFGLPVVCTLRGIDGLPNKINNGCLVSDDAQIFADNIVRLLNNKVLYKEQSTQGYDIYKTYYNPVVRYKQLDEIFGVNANFPVN
ncbi:glycosyltransferase [Prevotella sp. 10(H)]|uniref:glycosyltransferase n=1 Tax=Prevotella sp. 10(H) TaxID=1158294 RepID=UPI00068ABC33|nr:glycosyltransferase [Prevotella sp. 10(H)]